jgi:DNA-binding transcriptional LysR family regulator
MIDLNSLVIFATVIDASSFSEAARRLKMPVSTVSRRIAELEDQLGVRLLERSTRNLRLTDVGSEVLEQARRSAEISEALDNGVSNRLSNISGMLRLSAPPNISDALLEPLVRAFQASYPDVRIQIFVTDRYIDHIAEGIDLVFRIGAGAERDSSLVAKKIMTYHTGFWRARRISRSQNRLKIRRTCLTIAFSPLHSSIRKIAGRFIM